MRKKKLTLLFNPLWPEHLNKDVFLVPYYLGRKLNYDVSIVYTKSEKNKDLPNLINGVKMESLNPKSTDQKSSLWELLKNCSYIIKNAKSIDMLMFIRSCSPYYEILALIYKKLNSKGKVYVKLDISLHAIDSENKSFRFSLNYFIHQRIKSNALKRIDCFSCETLITYQKLEQTKLPQFQFGNRLQLLSNGFDEEFLKKLNLEEKSFEEKENLIITVGRLGSPEKNTEMFLRALAKVNLGNWKVCLIGSIDSKIEDLIKTFYTENPDKLESVKFIGPIFDKKELWEFYNRAKVFVLTSDWESYALVLNEAKRFRNYIVSTEVGASQDLIEEEKYGVSIPVNDDSQLARILNEIVSEKRNINVYKDYDANQLSWENQIEKLKL